MSSAVAPTQVVADHKIVSKEEWKASRDAMLVKEKALTRQRDALTQEIRAQPWLKIDKVYTFDTPEGKKTLAELFKGKSQLFMYHFMLAKNAEEGCSGCSFWADSFAGMALHLPQRDVTFTAVSSAPLKSIEAFKKRLGWSFGWVSAAESDFNIDFEMSSDKGEQPGWRIFYKEGEDVYMTYYTTGRGGEVFNPVYQALDLVPKGRDEADQVPHPMAWVKHHDQY